MVQENVLPDVDISSYVGQWVVVCENKIVAHNKDLTRIQKDIGKCKRTPTVAKIPKKENLIF